MTYNEGTELDTTSDENTESSSETPSTESSESGSDNNSQLSSESKTKPDEANLPFHEHPRFKELVEQKNQAVSQQKALEERYAAMEARMQQLSNQPKPQAAVEKDELIEHLRTIDPKFAARFEQMSKSLPQVESLQQELQTYKNEQIRATAVQNINNLHEQNKVSPELRSLINAQIDAQAISGQLRDLKDIPNAYKAIHDQYSKFVEGIKRAERESYVTAKKADAKTPTSQPKGTPASPASKKQSFSKDPEVARQQVVSQYLKSVKAEADAL